jgi:hypothetical protein
VLLTWLAGKRHEALPRGTIGYLQGMTDNSPSLLISLIGDNRITVVCLKHCEAVLSFPFLQDTSVSPYVACTDRETDLSRAHVLHSHHGR